MELRACFLTFRQGSIISMISLPSALASNLFPLAVLSYHPSLPLYPSSFLLCPSLCFLCLLHTCPIFFLSSPTLCFPCPFPLARLSPILPLAPPSSSLHPLSYLPHPYLLSHSLPPSPPVIPPSCPTHLSQPPCPIHLSPSLPHPFFPDPLTIPLPFLTPSTLPHPPLPSPPSLLHCPTPIPPSPPLLYLFPSSPPLPRFPPPPPFLRPLPSSSPLPSQASGMIHMVDALVKFNPMHLTIHSTAARCALT